MSMLRISGLMFVCSIGTSDGGVREGGTANVFVVGVVGGGWWVGGEALLLFSEFSSSFCFDCVFSTNGCGAYVFWREFNSRGSFCCGCGSD